jgi:hypothetical protein
LGDNPPHGVSCTRSWPRSHRMRILRR